MKHLRYFTINLTECDFSEKEVEIEKAIALEFEVNEDGPNVINLQFNVGKRNGNIQWSSANFPGWVDFAEAILTQYLSKLSYEELDEMKDPVNYVCGHDIDNNINY